MNVEETLQYESDTTESQLGPPHDSSDSSTRKCIYARHDTSLTRESPTSKSLLDRKRDSRSHLLGMDS
jgi:hypothetical protein